MRFRRKPPEQNRHLRLVSDNPNPEQPLSDAATTARLVGNPVVKLAAEEDIKERPLDLSRTDILDIDIALNEAARNYINDDVNLYSLDQSFFMVGQIAHTKFRDINRYVIASLRESFIVSDGRREHYASARTYSAMQVLKAGFNSLFPDGQFDVNGFDSFAETYPSRAWADVAVTRVALHGIHEAKLEIDDLARDYATTPQGFLKQVDDALLLGMGMEAPSADASDLEMKKFESKRNALIAEAWEYWRVERGIEPPDISS